MCKLIVRTLLALALVALFGAPAAHAQANLPAEITGAVWDLVSLTSAGGTAEDVTGGGITMEFSEGNAVSGSGGCNRYRTSYTSTGAGKVTFAQAASTLMACSDPQGSREPVFLQALSEVDSYSLAGDRLTLSGPGGVELVFTRAATAGGMSGSAGTGGSQPSTLPPTGGEERAALWLALAGVATAIGAAGLALRRHAVR